MGKGGRESLLMSDGLMRNRLREKISWEEIRRHKTPYNAWLVHRNKVYDVSGWHQHPGGSVIFTYAGEDCTDIFAAFHPVSALSHLEHFCIGEVDSTTEDKSQDQKDFERAYRRLRNEVISAGLFRASALYYTGKILSNLLIAAAAWALVVCFSSLVAQLASAFLIALFWQQCGWLAHDFLHHQVFRNRAYGDLAGILIGNVFQGFSVAWWKNKHNTHHAVPNLIESSREAQDGDPDIDTMPLLAWSLSMARTAKDSRFGVFFVRHQALLYFPILLVARISWLLQSWSFVFDSSGGVCGWSTKGTAQEKQVIKNLRIEKIGLILYWLWYSALMFGNMSLWRAALYFCTSQMFCGLLLATVFGLGHNGMAVYDAEERPNFWRLQVTTTRNVRGGRLVHWFCGGLGYQVDHHLFPMVPRHHLASLHQIVEAFCKEHKVQYHETSMWEGSREVLQHLAHVTESFLAEFPAM